VPSNNESSAPIEDAHDFHVVLPFEVGFQDFVVERRAKGRNVISAAFRQALESLIVNRGQTTVSWLSEQK
jgi:hypothetical protein